MADREIVLHKGELGVGTEQGGTHRNGLADDEEEKKWRERHPSQGAGQTSPSLRQELIFGDATSVTTILEVGKFPKQEPSEAPPSPRISTGNADHSQYRE